MERLSEARIAEMAEKLAGCDYPWVEAVADVRALLQDRVLLRGERDEARQQQETLGEMLDNSYQARRELQASIDKQEQEIATLTAELDAALASFALARRQRGLSEDAKDAANSALQALQGACEQLEKALMRYGHHSENCAWVQNQRPWLTVQCDCGFDATFLTTPPPGALRGGEMITYRCSAKDCKTTVDLKGDTPYRAAVLCPRCRRWMMPVKPKPTVVPSEPKETTVSVLPAVCLDCGQDYSDFGMDVLLPRWQWLLIHPDDGGLLCAQCIVNRAAQIKGAVGLQAVIGIQPL